MRYNRAALVVHTVAGRIAHPVLPTSPYRVGRDGRLRVLPGTGGIVLSHAVGDRAVGLAGDHVEPGAACKNGGAANRAFMAFSCVGNTAEVISGPQAGARGVVTGKHGGIDHVLVHFAPTTLARLRIGDTIQVRAVGQGLRLLDAPRVRVLNAAPQLLVRWGLAVGEDGRLTVPVTHLVPGELMGSGYGKPHGVLGDQDIQLTSPELNRRFRLDELRFGDLVAIHGTSAAWGPSVRRGAITVGVVVHSDSTMAGHGPGVTPLLVATSDDLVPYHSAEANLARVLGLRSGRALAPVSAPRSAERAAWDAMAAPAGRRTPRSPAPPAPRGSPPRSWRTRAEDAWTPYVH